MAVGEGRQVCAPDRRGPVFDLPPSPEVGSGRSHGLVRIVDPAGFAVAWIDPGSARCLEFVVRSLEQDQTAWRSVFAVPGGQEMDVSNAGCGVLAVAGDSASWGMRAKEDADWPGAEWRLLQRDPTSIILQAALPDEDGAVAGNVLARLVAQLDDATLSLSLTVQNGGAVARLVAFGFRGMFPPGLEIDSVVAPRLTTAAAGASHVGVTCGEGVWYLDPGVGSETGNLTSAMLGAPPGQPVLLLPGAHERLAIALSMFSDADGRTETLHLRVQDDR